MVDTRTGCRKPADPQSPKGMPTATMRPFRAGPPSIPATVFITLLLFVPLGLQQPLLNSDGDLARHLRHGRFMLEHGSLIRADPFSFTRPGAPFVAFEYGSQVAYALAERAGGLPGVAILAGLLIATTYALVARFLLRRGVDPLLAYITAVLAALAGAGHWLARPHLFTLVAVMILLDLLERESRQPVPVFAALFAALFAVWANMHGGFMYGWILIALYLGGSCIEALAGPDRSHWSSRVRNYAVALVAAVAATALTPHGIALYRHLADLVGQHYLFDNTQEFTSPDFHEVGAKLFLGALVLSVAVIAAIRKRLTVPRFLVVCVGIVFALIAVRNITLFGLTALPVLALHADQSWRDLPLLRELRGRFETTARRSATLVWCVPVGLAMLALALSHGRVGPVQLISRQFDSTVFPVAAVEHARSQRLEGRIFGEFTWNGYLEYAWPEQKIFIDGGTDFFGEALFREYSRIKTLGSGWRNVLEKWDISALLLKRESPLARESVRDGRWRMSYCDSLAVILRRSSGPEGWSPSSADSAEHAMTTCYAAFTVRRSPPLHPGR